MPLVFQPGANKHCLPVLRRISTMSGSAQAISQPPRPRLSNLTDFGSNAIGEKILGHFRLLL